MFEVTVLGSGSSGNATLVRSGRTSILIDAGLSYRQICLRLHAVGCGPADLDAVLVSHEHGDHVKGLRILCARQAVPVYTAVATLATRELREAAPARVEPIRAGKEFRVGELTVEPFCVPHDAADPLGFAVSCNGLRLGYVTDLGFATALTRERLRDCHLLVLEANHDRDMLIDGPYPWPVKQRILSRFGHLSNGAAAELLGEVAGPELRAVVLAHISRHNNLPELARAACEESLQACGGLGRPRILVAGQDAPTETVRPD